MPIVALSTTPSEPNPSLLLIELQGTIQTSDPSASLPIGALTLHPNGTDATLEIGNHTLEGAVVEMEPPVAVLRKGSKGMEVCALVREKVVFRTRPVPRGN